MYVLEFAGQDDPFAAREAATAASDVTPIGPGVATTSALGDTVDQLAFTRRASTLLGTTDASVESAVALLRTVATDGEGSVAVRARDVRSTSGVSTQTAERELGAVLADRGHAIDLDSPDRTLVALFAGPADDASAPDADPGTNGVCALGWRTVEPDRSFADRTPTDRPFFQPGSMDPQLARALVNLAGGRPGATVLDPMCGTGGLLIEAGRVGATPVGGDAQRKMVTGTRRNLDALLDGPFHVYRGDAARPPLLAGSVDGVVFDAPYGRQSKIAGDLDDIVADCLGAAADLAPRAVVVGDRPWAAAAREAGWTVESTFVRRVHRSLDRHVAVLRK